MWIRTNETIAQISRGKIRLCRKRQRSPAFFGIGGVLLTDGWDRHARKRAAAIFKLDWAEMEDRHHLNWDMYQEGKLTLEEYLGWVVVSEAVVHQKPDSKIHD